VWNLEWFTQILDTYQSYRRCGIRFTDAFSGRSRTAGCAEPTIGRHPLLHGLTEIGLAGAWQVNPLVHSEPAW